MKQLSLILSIFTLLFFTACDNPSLGGKEVKKEYFTGGQIHSEFIMDDDTGKNGFLKTYGYNGNITSTVTMRNGVKDGTQTWFDEKGRPIRKVPYINGLIHGTLLELYENGDTMVTIPFENNIKQGVAYAYNKDGTVHKQVVYKNGRVRN